jgi:SsrA-binding protein
MLLAKNRKALYKYEPIRKFMAGVVLRGYEVKAIREGKANLTGSYVQILGNEAFVVNMHIGRYSNQSQEVGDTKRSRKLLLQKREIEKLKQELQQKGKTAVPLALLLKKNMVKLELAIVKGRKKHEKKAVEKEKQIKRDLEIERKDRGL